MADDIGSAPYQWNCPGCGKYLVAWHPDYPKLCFECYCKGTIGFEPTPFVATPKGNCE